MLENEFEATELQCVDCGHKFLDEDDFKYHNLIHDYEGFTTRRIRNEYNS